MAQKYLKFYFVLVRFFYFTCFLGSVRFDFFIFSNFLGSVRFGSVRFAFSSTVWTEKSVRFGRTAWPYT